MTDVRPDRVLDWKPGGHDPRSLNHPIRTLIGEVERVSRFWMESPLRLNQGDEGKCVGYGWIAEVLGQPRAVKIGDGSLSAAEQFATEVYRAAQHIDEWDGNSYQGTSVLAGAKVIQSRGFMDGYRWAFGIDDVIDTLCAGARTGGGPVVLGIPWLTSMYSTPPNGLVTVDGSVVGGHCITATGYHPRMRFSTGGSWEFHEVVRWRNSWGPDYGRGGSAFIKVADLGRLLTMQGEACVPQGRRSRSV